MKKLKYRFREIQEPHEKPYYVTQKRTWTGWETVSSTLSLDKARGIENFKAVLKGGFGRKETDLTVEAMLNL